MASSLAFPILTPQEIRHILDFATPSGLADYVSLCIFSIIGAMFLSRGIVWDQPDPYEKLAFERPQLKKGGADGAVGHRETRDIARKLSESGKNIVIFWGSQSGTSEGFAHRLGRELHGRFGQETLTADLSDYNPDSIALIPKSKLTIFILSTYGEGDPSDNTADFWDWVTKTQNKSLENLRYVVFGLGNTNYKFYNRVVDVVANSLDRLGAIALMPVGKANDAVGGTAEDFMAWKNDLFHALTGKLGMVEREANYLPTMLVEEDELLTPIDLHHGEPASANNARTLPVSASYQLLGSSDRHCLHLDLDLNDHPQFTYKTGDHLAIWPGNPDSEVDLLLHVLDLSHRRHVPVNIKSLDPTVKVAIPSPTTCEAIFRNYLEVGALLTRDGILALAQFAPSPDAKEFLLNLGQRKEPYADFVRQNHLTLGRLLQMSSPSQKWSAIPLALVIETLPQMQPRYYSISSSSVVSPRTPSITVAASQTPVSEKPQEIVHGITSNYLLALSSEMYSDKPQPQGVKYFLDGPNNALQGGKIFAHIRKSKFKLPTASSCPLIMVAAGTGIAPFRGFIAERCRLQQIGKPTGEMILFFGCRDPDEDFIYQAELEEMARALSGKLRMITAFSRSQLQPRTYVQDRIRESGADVTRLLDDDATLYVCGRAAMAREVEKSVENIMKTAKEWSDDDLDGWTKAMKRQRKWQEDVWG